MNDSKIYNAFHNLEKLSNDIHLQVVTLMGNISEWADDLEGIVEKESKDSSTFLLPKTPKERNTCRRKARKVLNSKCSVINSTFLQNESCDLDGTISTRTRNARRAGASKISELNITKDTNLEESKQEVIVEQSSVGNVSDATFVMPKANTRTKPVLKVKQSEALVPELEKNELTTTTTEISKSHSPQEKVPEVQGERRSRGTISKSPSESSVERLSAEKTPIVVIETPVKRPSSRKPSRALSESPGERSSMRKVSRTRSGSPAVRRSRSGNSRSENFFTLPTERPKSCRNVSESPSRRSGENVTRQQRKLSTPKATESRSPIIDKTITIKKEFTPNAMSTFIVFNETYRDSASEKERENEKSFSRLSKTSTSATDEEKTPVAEVRRATVEENQSEEPANATEVGEHTTNAEFSVNETEEAADSSEVPKKKRKVKKEELKENIEEAQETMRITRTKSKAIKQMMEENETKQADLSSLAKKVLNKAKMTSVKKSQLAALLECNSSTPGHVGNALPFGNLTSSKSKYHLLLSSSKKLKTPSGAIAKGSGDRERPQQKILNGDASAEQLVRTVTKPPKDDLEREMKLKSRKEKEKEAALKRQNVIKSKQEELRRKNELKHQMALKQREKLEQEKYQNMIQSEKEKEERHKIILQERQAKVKEEAQKRKMLTQQKIAETVERRRMEEEARIAKLKEMEAEEQRLALEKQKEQERQEKRAQERLAQKKAREDYEMQLKQELEAERLKAEKLLTAKKCMPSASKLQSASKRQKFGIIGEKREWDYKPRNENDYGLEDEHSEVDSEDERCCSKSKPAIPWAKKILEGRSASIKVINLEMLCEFLPCYQKSPDIHKMFKMTPSKRIKRSSSAIWNTPSS